MKETDYFSKLPFEFGETFFFNDGKTLHECTFIGLGITINGVPELFYTDENEDFCSAFLNTPSVFGLFETLEDAISGSNNRVQNCNSNYFNHKILREFLLNSGYESVFDASNGFPSRVKVYRFENNSCVVHNSNYSISFDVYGNVFVETDVNDARTREEFVEKFASKISIKRKPKEMKIRVGYNVQKFEEKTISYTPPREGMSRWEILEDVQKRYKSEGIDLTFTKVVEG